MPRMVTFPREATRRGRVVVADHSDRRFVENGRVICSAGIAAGIDMSLHVVARLLGKEVAEKAARQMEYPWQP